ncbi:DMT family transporter [Sinimarinibacterium sp. CAU 1509]|uniref:DMT family transporter n=1 Tax=Sinimarinibacterium sp. CAU 1509 TaxID=2562283 RepID=UPI0010AD3F05|nr:DMT family transporter [Sinimarinibacterium sp. CAU 1509]TJY59801.1 DMT family transporter [Sinimarinibacterium sp. CAU 1509]
MIARTSILAALAAALLFGGSTPFAKALAGDVSPILLAGLLYLGSGIGLWVIRLIRDRGFAWVKLPKGEWPWLLGAIASGGVLGPVLLMYGLTRTSAGSASLLLNLEAVFTATMAWVVFRENADRRVVLGMALIVAGGAVLAWPQDHLSLSGLMGPLAIAAACLCWALDNNLTRKVSASDAVFIAGTKGLVAGGTNCALALVLGAHWPAPGIFAGAMMVGLAGYGLSLVLFVLALRGLGAARTGAYFSTAPFMGAVIAVLGFHEPTTPMFWWASGLMALGVALHLMERHAHQHTHEPTEHEHVHVHDEHHQHTHDFQWDGSEPHTHPHRHEPLTHSHAHYPDVHHRHAH